MIRYLQLVIIIRSLDTQKGDNIMDDNHIIMYDTKFHAKIAQTSLSVFNSLPKTGKPNLKEWTVLSTIVRHKDNCFTVVAMATGSKCIGGSQMSPEGDILNDSHAEVLCRRGFMRYLYTEMHDASDTLAFKDGSFELGEGVTFHFFTTHVPCGDASIFSKNDGENVGCALDDSEVGLEKESELNYEQKRIGEAKFQNLTQNEVGTTQNEAGTIQFLNVTSGNCDLTSIFEIGSSRSQSVDTENCSTQNEGKTMQNEVITIQNELTTTQNAVRNQSDVKFAVDDVEVMLQTSKPESEVGTSQIEVRNKAKHQLPSSEGEASNPKRKKSDVEDIYRTGAKCLPDDAKQDPHEAGVGYHLTGAVRTKPGRGDPTQSVSCSDKMAKWSLLGVQGALLSLLLREPIYLSTFTITSGTPFSQVALNRALQDRLPPVELTGNYRRNTMGVAQVDATFEFAKCEDKRPCPSSTIYCYKQKPEIAVEGHKQGVTKKNFKKPSSHLSIHKVELLRAFLHVARHRNIVPEENLKCSYGELKCKAEVYRENRERVKKAFKIWTHKDSRLLDFCTSL